MFDITWLADASSSGTSIGIVGIATPLAATIAFMTGLIVPGFMYKKVDAENDRLRALVEKVIPLAERMTGLLEEALRLLPDPDRPPRRRGGSS